MQNHSPAFDRYEYDMNREFKYKEKQEIMNLQKINTEIRDVKQVLESMTFQKKSILITFN